MDDRRPDQQSSLRIWLHGLGNGIQHPFCSSRDRQANYDAVLLDIGLGDEHSPELADLLKEAGTPFAFVTGYDHAAAPRHADVPLLHKPFSPTQLVEC